MARIKNISGEDRLVPWLGGRLVLDGQVVDIPNDDVAAYCCQPDTWAPADAATKKLAAQSAPAEDADPTSTED